MDLINVVSASHTATEGVIDFVLEADIGNGQETIPFTYTPADPYGLSPSVGAFLEANPTFPVAEYEPPPIPLAALHVERDRRLALGFDYDFNDVRGVHRIKTTPADMVGWDEVTKFAQTLINGGQGSYTITIATGTGVTQLTATEWQGVIIASAAFRQPIWGASFVIEGMSPIPSDYTDNAYWG